MLSVAVHICFAVSHFAEWVMLNVIMLSVIVLNVVVLQLLELRI